MRGQALHDGQERAARSERLRELLIQGSPEGKRINYSTSHAEAVSAVRGSQNAQYVALRFTDILMKPWIQRTSTTSLSGLMNLQEQGLTVMPVEMGTD
eukprot:428612-Pyramimonas_sp.AAC.1